MSTSGTVGLTRYDTRKLIDNAYGVCRIVRQEITPERIEIAKDWLFLRLSAMANKGIPLWAVSKTILPIYQNVYSVPCPIGATNVLDLNLRRTNRISQGTASSSAGVAVNAFDDDLETICTTAADGYIQLEFDAGETFIPMFGILPGASGVWNFTLQGSNNGIAWTTFDTITDLVVVDGEWYWWDLEGQANWMYIRIQATNGTVLSLRELVFSNNPNEINMALINRDNYSTLPNKFSQPGQPTQYWLNKERVQQIITLWPPPALITRYWNLVGYLQYQIEDVGSLREEIQFRQSAYRGLTLKLGYDLSLVDKEAKPSELLPEEAERAWKDMWDGESDDAPTSLTPNIGPYTR